MLKQNKIVIKKFLLSIKNAVMAMSVETLKESSIQEVLDNLEAMNELKDSGFDMDSPIVIKVGERKEIKVSPSYSGNEGKWQFMVKSKNVAEFFIENNSVYIRGLSEGSTQFSCEYWKNGFYSKDGADPEAQFEESSIEVIVEASNSPDIDDGDIGSDIPGITPPCK